MNTESIKTLKDLLEAAADEYCSRPYIRYKAGEEIRDKSYSDFRNDSEKIGCFLVQYCKKTLHIGVIGDTSYEYLAAYFGTVISGNVIVPIDAQLTKEDICDCLNCADVDILFYDNKFESIISYLEDNCLITRSFINLHGQENEHGFISLAQILCNKRKNLETEVNQEECCTIIYTSGTTGKSKGVMLSHHNLISNAMCDDKEGSTEDIVLTILPIHHVYCICCDILLSMRYGATVCINDSIFYIAKNLKLFRPTSVMVVPLIAESIYKQISCAVKAHPDISPKEIASQVFGGRLKIFYSGGAYLSPDLIRNYEKLGITVEQGYGMTECSPRIAKSYEGSKYKDISVGKPVRGCQVRFCDGEIQVMSPSVMIGYYKNEEATKEAFTEGGWLKTGDLGYQDKEGYLYITGRKKNLIILSSGENISPEELENKLYTKPIIQEVVVRSINGLITAEIFPNEEYINENAIGDINQAITVTIDEFNKEISPNKHIKRFIIRTNDFEKTTSKKIKIF